MSVIASFVITDIREDIREKVKMIDYEQSNACITQVSATILKLMGLSVGVGMADPIIPILEQANKTFENCSSSKVFIYNPDAIANWIYQKYIRYFKDMKTNCSASVLMKSVIPPVTPACFGSMYTGLMPKDHGIQKYEKYTLDKNTLFDELSKQQKKVAIVSTTGDSISILFLKRNIDYFIYDKIKDCNKKAFELIAKNEHDVILLYNGNYDYFMHRTSPTGFLAKRALKQNIKTYNALVDQLKIHYKTEDKTLLFAPDHGCHRWLGVLGNHGVDEPCDMEIRHFYTFIPKEK